MKQAIVLLLCPMMLLGQTQIGQDIDGEAAGDQSGRSVSVSADGTVVAIGSPGNDVNSNNSGHTRVFENLNGVWTQVGDDINGDDEFDNSGSSVQLSADGSILAVGFAENSGSNLTRGDGYVRVFENLNNSWVQIGNDINGEAEGDISGVRIDLSSDGTILAIAAPLNSGNGDESGHVRVYENISGVWTQIGQDIDGEAQGDGSGESVSLSSNGSILAIGAALNDGNGNNTGHVRVYENINGVWNQIGQDINGETEMDFSGSSVSLSGNGRLVAIGAPFNNANGLRSGHVRVYENINNNWTQIGNDLDGESLENRFGSSVAFSTNREILAVGAPSLGVGSGYVKIFQYINSNWQQVGSTINGEAVFDYFGGEVTLSTSGNFLGVGARDNNGNGNQSGHVRVFDLSSVLSVQDISKNNDIILYPNPAATELQIHLREGIILQKVIVYNSLGQKVYTTNNSSSLDISSLSQGTYIVELIKDHGIVSKKLIVE